MVNREPSAPLSSSREERISLVVGERLERISRLLNYEVPNPYVTILVRELANIENERIQRLLFKNYEPTYSYYKRKG